MNKLKLNYGNVKVHIGEYNTNEEAIALVVEFLSTKGKDFFGEETLKRWQAACGHSIPQQTIGCTIDGFNEDYEPECFVHFYVIESANSQ